MFAAITPALISGAFAERKRFAAFALFSLLWATLVYDPVAHWVWGDGGWLRRLGALDFAGGTVVHISSGVSALVCARVLGQRMGYGREPMEPHNATLTMLGTALLWFGWFGFNAGSALGSGSLAVDRASSTPTPPRPWPRSPGSLASWIRHRAAQRAGRGRRRAVRAGRRSPRRPDSSRPMAALLIGFCAGLGCFVVVEFVVRGRRG